MAEEEQQNDLPGQERVEPLAPEDDLFRAETVNSRSRASQDKEAEEVLTPDRNLDEEDSPEVAARNDEVEQPIEAAHEEYQEMMRDHHAEIDHIPNIIEQLQAAFDNSDEEGTLNDADANAGAIANEVGRVISEVEAEISKLQLKMASIGDIAPSLADQIGNLENVKTELQSLLASLNNPMTNVGLVMDQLKQLQQSAQSTVGLAETEANITLGEFKADFAAEMFDNQQRIESANRQLARETMAETSYYREARESLMHTTPELDGVSDSIIQDIVIARHQMATIDEETARNQLMEEEVFTPGSAAREEVEEIMRRDWEGVREYLKDSSVPQEERQKVRDLLVVHRHHLLPEMVEFIEKYRNGEHDEAEYEALMEQGHQRIDGALSLAYQGLDALDPDLRLAILRGAAEEGVSVTEYLREHANDDAISALRDLGENVDINALSAEDQLKYALGTVATNADNNLELQSIVSYGIANRNQLLSLTPEDQSKITELADLSHDELIERLQGEDFQPYLDYLTQSPTERIEQLVNDVNLPEPLREQALFMERMVDVAINPSSSPAEKAAQRIQIEQALTRAMTIAPREGESDLEYRLRFQDTMKDIVENSTLNPRAIDFINDPGLIEQIRQLSSSTGSDQEFAREFDALLERHAEHTRQNYVERLRADGYNVDNMTVDQLAERVTELQFQDKRRDEINDIIKIVDQEFDEEHFQHHVTEQGNFTAEQYQQWRVDTISNALKARGFNDEDAISVAFEEEANRIGDERFYQSGFHPLIEGGDHIDQEREARQGQQEIAFRQLAATAYRLDPSKFTNAPEGSASWKVYDAARDHMIQQMTAQMQETHASLNYDERQALAASQVDIRMAMDAGARADTLLSINPDMTQEELTSAILSNPDYMPNAANDEARRRIAEIEAQVLIDRQIEGQERLEQSHTAAVTVNATGTIGNVAAGEPVVNADQVANSNFEEDPAKKAEREMVANMVKAGMDPQMAAVLARQTVGAGQQLANSGVTGEDQPVANNTPAASGTVEQQAAEAAAPAAEEVAGGADAAQAEEKVAPATPDATPDEEQAVVKA